MKFQSLVSFLVVLVADTLATPSTSDDFTVVQKAYNVPQKHQNSGIQMMQQTIKAQAKALFKPALAGCAGYGCNLVAELPSKGTPGINCVALVDCGECVPLVHCSWSKAMDKCVDKLSATPEMNTVNSCVRGAVNMMMNPVGVAEIVDVPNDDIHQPTEPPVDTADHEIFNQTPIVVDDECWQPPCQQADPEIDTVFLTCERPPCDREEVAPVEQGQMEAVHVMAPISFSFRQLAIKKVDLKLNEAHKFLEKTNIKKSQSKLRFKRGRTIATKPTPFIVTEKDPVTLRFTIGAKTDNAKINSQAVAWANTGSDRYPLWRPTGDAVYLMSPTKEVLACPLARGQFDKDAMEVSCKVLGPGQKDDKTKKGFQQKKGTEGKEGKDAYPPYPYVATGNDIRNFLPPAQYPAQYPAQLPQSPFWQSCSVGIVPSVMVNTCGAYYAVAPEGYWSCPSQQLLPGNLCAVPPTLYPFVKTVDQGCAYAVGGCNPQIGR